MILLIFSFHSRVPIFPLIPYNIKFVQCGFTERAAFEESITALDDSLLHLLKLSDTVPYLLVLQIASPIIDCARVRPLLPPDTISSNAIPNT
jgi:hypothetical protein